MCMCALCKLGTQIEMQSVCAFVCLCVYVMCVCVSVSACAFVCLSCVSVCVCVC